MSSVLAPGIMSSEPIKQKGTAYQFFPRQIEVQVIGSFLVSMILDPSRTFGLRVSTVKNVRCIAVGNRKMGLYILDHVDLQLSVLLSRVTQQYRGTYMGGARTFFGLTPCRVINPRTEKYKVRLSQRKLKMVRRKRETYYILLKHFSRQSDAPVLVHDSSSALKFHSHEARSHCVGPDSNSNCGNERLTNRSVILALC